MELYKQLLYILGFSFAGEVISNVFQLPMPGSVIGMLLLFCALQFKFIKVHQVEKVGAFLLENLSILFLPAGVGIMVYFPIIRKNWWLLLLITFITTGVSIGFIGKLVQWVKRKYEEDAIDIKQKGEQK